MIVSIELTDFMAHAHAVIELGPGLTVLSGPNNCGKSAIVEALRCVAENPSSARHYIRHGAKQATVAVNLDDGTRITWGRKPDYPWYELLAPGAETPATFHKLGRENVPEEVAKALRLGQVVIEKKEFDVHLGDQRDPVFLLRAPGSARAAFFAASSESGWLIEMQKLLAARVKGRKQEVKRLESEMAGLRAELVRACELERAEAGAVAARELFDGLTRARRAEDELVRRAAELAGLEARRDAISIRLEALAPAQPPPAVHDVRSLAGAATGMRALREWEDRHFRTAGALAELREPPVLADAARLAELAIELRALDISERENATLAEKLADLASPPGVKPVADLARLTSELERLAARELALAARLSAAPDIGPPPSPVDETGPAAAAREVAGLVRAESEAAKALTDAEAALNRADTILAQRLAALGHCPLCNADLELARFTGKAEAPRG